MRGLTELERVVSLGGVCVLLQCSDIVHVERNRLSRTLLHTPLARLLRRCLSGFEFSLVHAQAELLRHETGEVDGEAVRVVQSPDVLAVELLLPGLERLLRVLLEELLAAVERARERLFLLV